MIVTEHTKHIWRLVKGQENPILPELTEGYGETYSKTVIFFVDGKEFAGYYHSHGIFVPLEPQKSKWAKTSFVEKWRYLND